MSLSEAQRNGLESIYQADLHCSSGIAPHKPHATPSSFNRGLLLAQVPANFPSFFAQILIAIPAKAKANSPIAMRINFMISRFYKGTHYFNFHQ